MFLLKLEESAPKVKQRNVLLTMVPRTYSNKWCSSLVLLRNCWGQPDLDQLTVRRCTTSQTANFSHSGTMLKLPTLVQTVSHVNRYFMLEILLHTETYSYAKIPDTTQKRNI